MIPAALKAEELRKLCADFDFDEEKIDEYLKCLEIDEKYRGIQAFEWQETKTTEQKNKDRKLKKLQAERERRREEKRVAFEVEKEARRVEREIRKEQRRKEIDERKAARKVERESKKQ